MSAFLVRVRQVKSDDYFPMLKPIFLRVRACILSVIISNEDIILIFWVVVTHKVVGRANFCRFHALNLFQSNNYKYVAHNLILPSIAHSINVCCLSQSYQWICLNSIKLVGSCVDNTTVTLWVQNNWSKKVLHWFL